MSLKSTCTLASFNAYAFRLSQNGLKQQLQHGVDPAMSLME